MTRNFKAFQSPEDKLKTMILERYDLAANADAEGANKKFCKQVKHFLLLLKSDIPKTIQEVMEKRHTEMEKKVKAILDNKDLSLQERETLAVKEEYAAYCQDLIDGVDSMRNSKIMKRRITGIMLSGKSLKDMDKLGKEIRDSDAVETVIDNEEDIDGIELI